MIVPEIRPLQVRGLVNEQTSDVGESSIPSPDYVQHAFRHKPVHSDVIRSSRVVNITGRALGLWPRRGR